MRSKHYITIPWLMIIYILCLMPSSGRARENSTSDSLCKQMLTAGDEMLAIAKSKPAPAAGAPRNASFDKAMNTFFSSRKKLENKDPAKAKKCVARLPNGISDEQRHKKDAQCSACAFAAGCPWAMQLLGADRF